jgi:GNAT superfamily N-acetyltransferase
VEIRATTVDDLPAQVEVFRAAVGELFRRHSFAPPDPPADVFSAQQRHLLEHDGERCFSAFDRRRLVGFGAAFQRGTTWFLSSLFVIPAHQQHGVGRRLLEACWGAATRRLTIADAIQPVSQGLYASVGLLPAAPVLNLAGDARPVEPPVALEPRDPAASGLDEVDRAAYGFSRPADHAFWRSRARGTLWRADGAAVAYSYAWPQGRIGPVAGRTPEAAAAALARELARRAGERCVVIAPASARSLVEVALLGGLRFAEPPALLLASRGTSAPDALALSGYSLY